MITRGIRGGYPGRVLSYTYNKYNIYIYLSISHIYFFIKFSFLIIFHILFVSSYILLIILVTVYYHHIVLLCFSYHVIYHISHAPTPPGRVIGVQHCVELGLFNLYLPFSQIKKKHLHLHYKQGLKCRKYRPIFRRYFVYRELPKRFLIHKVVCWKNRKKSANIAEISESGRHIGRNIDTWETRAWETFFAIFWEIYYRYIENIGDISAIFSIYQSIYRLLLLWLRSVVQKIQRPRSSLLFKRLV